MSTSLGEGSVATVQLRADYQLDLTGTGVVTSNTAGQQRVTQVTGSATTIGPFSQDMTCVLVGGAGGLTFETSSSLAGVGGGAAAFTDLTDAPATVTPMGLVIGNAEGTELVMPDWATVDEEARTLSFRTPNPDPEFIGASVGVSTPDEVEVGTRLHLVVVDGLATLNGACGATVLNLDVGPTGVRLYCDPGLELAGIDVAASDATATMTVNAVEYSIAKAVQVKIGSDTYFWPLFGPVAP